MSDIENSVSGEEIRKIATLSRLNLSDEEITQASYTISQILGSFEVIRSVDTKNILPADDVSGLKNIVREDVVRENILATPEELLRNAKTSNGYVQVPGVFSNSDTV